MLQIYDLIGDAIVMLQLLICFRHDIATSKKHKKF